MNKNKVFFLVFMILISGIPLLTVKAIPYDAWNNYKILNFPDGFEGLQVNFNVTYGHGDNGLSFNCQEDFEDLRFFNYEDDILLYAYNETTVNSNYCEIWLKLGSSKNVTMRYNNPEANAYWDLENTFEDVIDNVVLALPMDEGSGSVVYDYSGNNNDGVVTNPLWVDGKYNSALNFSGSEKIVISTSDSLRSLGNEIDISVVMWFNYDSMVDGRLIYKYGLPNYGFSIFSTTTGVLRYIIWGTTTSLTPFGIGNFTGTGWNCVVMSYNNTSNYLYAYVNNIADISPTSGNVGNFSGDSSIGIGAHFAGSSFYKGLLDEIMIFPFVLSNVQRSNVYEFYPDLRIIEGSVCCRVWDESTVIFGIEFSNFVNDALLIGVLALVFAMCALLLIIIKKK